MEKSETSNVVRVGDSGTDEKQEEMEVAELKVLRFSSGVTRMDNIRNEYISWTARNSENTREARLRSYGHWE